MRYRVFMWIAMGLLSLISNSARAASDGGAVSQRLRLVQAYAARLASRRPLQLLKVAPNRTILRQYEKLELTIDLTATYRNPYDPDDILVQARFDAPGGGRVTVPGFYYEPYEPVCGQTVLAGGVSYRPAGAACWKVRFAPRRVGEYRCVVSARGRAGGRVESAPIAFRVKPSPAPGFVRVSRRAPRYFEFENGTLFYPSGANVAWTHERSRGKPFACYEYYFRKLAAAGGNATRVWICHWSWLEWTPKPAPPESTFTGYAGAGCYNQKVAAAFDRIFALAERYHLKVVLCTDDNNELFTHRRGYGNWEWHPYNTRNGGPCRTPAEFWTNAKARRLYKRRLYYINARWGYSTSFWCWNFWNDCGPASDAESDWLRDIYRYVRSIQTNFPDRPAGTNFGHDGAAFLNDAMDYVNGGGGEDYFERVRRLGDYWRRKPFVAFECAFDSDPKWFLDSVHRSFWRALGWGLAGAMCWDWMRFDQCGWRGFKPILKFVQDIPLNREPFSPARVRAARVRLRDPEKPFQTPVRLRPVHRWGRKAPRRRFDVSLAGCPQRHELYAALYGYNRGRRAWRTTPTFIVRSPAGAWLCVTATEIGAGDQILQIAVDGRTAVRKPLTRGRRSVEMESERYTRVAIPPGRHLVVVSNEGGDWIRIGAYTFLFSVTDARRFPPLEILGRQSRGAAFLWVHNIFDSKLARSLGMELRPIEALTLELTGMSAGSYDVEWWDTRQGRVVSRATSTTRGGRLSFECPCPLSSDIACRARRRRGR